MHSTHGLARAAAADLAHEIGIRDLRARHLDEVGDPVVEGLLRGFGSIMLPCKTIGTAAGDPVADGTGQVAVESGWHVRVGPVAARCRAPPRTTVSRSIESASAAASSAADSGVMPAHGASSSQDNRSARTRSEPIARAHPGDHLAREAQPVRAVGVGALVREPGVELPEQAGRAGIELDPVRTGARRERCRLGEPGDDRGDFGGLHFARQFARSRVRDRRRRRTGLLREYAVEPCEPLWLNPASSRVPWA